MPTRLFAFLFLSMTVLSAATKTAAAKGENEDLGLTVTLYIDPPGIQELVGSDLGGHYIVADVKVTPKYGKEVRIERDDFVLRTDKDGEKSRPFVGNQIAGQASLIVSPDGAEVRKSRGWSIGGPIMTGGGNSDADKAPSKAAMKTEDQENPLKKALDSKILPEKKTDQPVSGLLYFPMEKQKLKDLELIYTTAEGKISLRFKGNK